MEPWIDEEPEIMHPGPEITLLLTQQTNHQLEIIWNGEVKYLVLTTVLFFTKQVSLLASSTFSKFFQSCISSSNNRYNFYWFCRTREKIINARFTSTLLAKVNSLHKFIIFLQVDTNGIWIFEGSIIFSQVFVENDKAGGA